MASTREIRRRIRGVRSLKQVTRAMNMIAAARLRRARQKAESARPYAERLREIFEEIEWGGGVEAKHPFLVEREARRIGIVLVSSDRGLAGPFHANIARETGRFIERQRAEVGLLTVGKKGRDFFFNRGFVIDRHFSQVSGDVTMDDLGAISKQVMSGYHRGLYDRVFLAYSRFVNVLKSSPTIIPLLPIESRKKERSPSVPRTLYQFEPPAERLLDTLLPQYVEVLIYDALVESMASEQAARMIAMKNATDSATEMIDQLTREYNRVRQASITEQILEVVSGAEALEETPGEASTGGLT